MRSPTLLLSSAMAGCASVFPAPGILLPEYLACSATTHCEEREEDWILPYFPDGHTLDVTLENPLEADNEVDK